MSSKVHNVKFFRPKPKAIYCMALNRSLKKLAVSRSDASIEIWNLSSAPFIESKIPTSVQNYSIEGLAWANKRLFSVGLHALLIEYNLNRLEIKQQTTVTGQTAFCLDVNPAKTDICVGTEQGYINIFNITEENLMFNKFLDKQEGRILCVKYDSTGNFIASSSLDCIRVWDVTTGHALHKMTTGRSEANKPTIVWCLQVTKDFTIISGDSRGRLTFWDGKQGAQIEFYPSHKADILSICLSDNEDSLYCAGIDPTIVNYQKIAVKDESKWVKCIQRNVHDHDIRGLSLLGGVLFSGGVDGYLGCSYHPPKVQIKFAPFKSCAQVAQNARLILLQYSKHLEVWNLAKETEDLVPQKLLVVERQLKTDLGRKREGILCSAISPNGHYICMSTVNSLRLFYFEFGALDNLQLNLIETQEEELEPFIKVSFASDSTHLIGCTKSGKIQVLKLQKLCEPIVVQTMETEDYLKELNAHFCLSACGEFIVLADLTGLIVVWKLNTEKNVWKYYCTLPHYKGSITALNVQPKTSNLVIVYSNHSIFEYDLKMKRLKSLDEVVGIKTSEIFRKDYAIKNIQFDGRNDNIIIFNDEQEVFVVNKEWKFEGGKKKAKISNGDAQNSEKYIKKVKASAIKKFKHIAQLEWLSTNELVAVQVNPLSLLEQLPPAFKQNKFGTM